MNRSQIAFDRMYPKKRINTAYIAYSIFVLFAVAIGFYFDYSDCLNGISC